MRIVRTAIRPGTSTRGCPRAVPADLASVIARLLVATSAAADPDQAFRYAKKARGLAARVGVVRETCAIAAYQAGDWNAALAEFRAARRLTGRASYLPLMADCERALGRLDRALDLVSGPDARAADRPTQIELRIVESGIRRDQGLFEAAVVALQGPELTGERIRPEFGGHSSSKVLLTAAFASNSPSAAQMWTCLLLCRIVPRSR